MPEAEKNGISVMDAHGNPLLFQMLSADAATHTYRLLIEAKNVPSLGYGVLHVVPGRSDATSDLHADGLTLENSLLRVTVDPHTGCITSLYDKQAKFESIASGGCGNELVAFKDTPKDYDAWNIDADFDQHFTKLDQADSVQLVEHGPLRAVIRVKHKWQQSEFVQDITLYAGLDRVDVVNDIDWHETHVLLKAAFPLAASSGDATYEIPYGSIQRPTTRNNSWEAAKFEVPALRWADLGDGHHGFSLINESKYGYDAKGTCCAFPCCVLPSGPIRMRIAGIIISATRYIRTRAIGSRPSPCGTVTISITNSSHAGAGARWKVAAAQSLITIEPENVVLTAVKKAEDSDGLILRFYEWAGKGGEVRVSVPAGATRATLTNLMEQPEGSPFAVTPNGQFTVPIRPHEIQSVRVDYPQRHASD